MKLKDIADYRELYESSSSQSKSYYVSLWFILITSLLHMILDMKISLDITLAYKWAVLAIFTLIGIFTFSNKVIRTINMHLLFVFITGLFIPYAFVTSGGQYSFVQYFVIVYLIMIFFMMDLKYAAIYAIYNFIQLEALYVLEERRPDLIMPVNSEWFALENAVTIPILMVVMVALVTILLVLYKTDEEKIKASNVKLRRDANLKETMLDITYEVTQNYNRESLTKTILIRLIESMETAEQGTIMRIQKRKAFYDSAIGYDIEALKDIVVPVQETYLYKATFGEMDKAVIITNLERMRFDEAASDALDMYFERSTLCAPIMLHGIIWGVLNVESVEGAEFKSSDIEFIKLFTNEMEKVLSFSELLEQNQKLRNYDYLTGIMNRMRFSEAVEKRISQLHNNHFSSFITCDLDNFKNINDQFGHSHGDDYLKYFVSIVSQFLDEGDIFGRTGGDEFQIFMYDKTPSQANEVMQKIQREFVQRPVVLRRNRILLRFSYGIVQCYKGDTISDISLRSDQMLYRNKQLNKLNSFTKEWTFNI
ncbi:MAG: sensor domain-containing diguanylate cyclase [Eubacteriales bacterium]